MLLRKFLDRLVSAFFLREEEMNGFLAECRVPEDAARLAMRFLRGKNEAYAVASQYDFRIISLGYNCLPCTVPTRWGIKPSAAMGERRLPFDLAVHDSDKIKGVLASRFREYAATDYGVKTSGPLEFYYYRNRGLGAYYNHDNFTVPAGCDPEAMTAAPGFFEKMNSVLGDRAAEFLSRAEAGNCLFVWCWQGDTPLRARLDDSLGYVAEVDDLLKGLNRTNKLVVLSFDDGRDSVEAHGDVTIVRLNPPTAQFHEDWFRPDFYFTEQGFDFEEKIIKALLGVVRKRFPEKKAQEDSHADRFGLYRNSASLYYHLGRFAFAQHHMELAKRSFERVEELRRDYLDTCCYLSQLFMAEGENEIAVGYARRAVEKDEHLFKAQIQLGSSLLRMGESRSALDAFARAVALEPGNAHAKFCMGLGSDAVGDNDAAVDSLKAAIEVNPDLVQYHHKLSLLQLKAGRLDEAEEAAGQCLGRNGKFSGSYYVMGRIHDARKAYPEALAAVEKAIELDGSIPAYENLRQGLLRKMGHG